MYVIHLMQQNAFHQYFVIFGKNQLPMKMTLAFLVLLSATLPVHLRAQSMGSNNGDFTTLNSLWLQTRDGKMINGNQDSVSREVFESQPVWVKCSRPQKPGESFVLIFQPPAAMARAYKLIDNKLSVEVLNQIKKAEQGTILSVMVQTANDSTPLYVLRMILK